MCRSLWAVCFEGRCVARAPASATGTSNARWSSQLAEQMCSPPAAVHHDAMWHSGTSVPHKHTRLGATACDPGDAHQGRPSDNPAPASQSRGTQHRRLRVHFKQCRSYRWSAEILPATDEQSILIHAYWGMGLHAPHPAVYGLCIRFHDSCAESKELIQRVLELTRLEPLLLARKISSVRVLVSSSRSHFLLLMAMLLLLLLCRLSLLCSLPLIHSIALFITLSGISSVCGWDGTTLVPWRAPRCCRPGSADSNNNKYKYINTHYDLTAIMITMITWSFSKCNTYIHMWNHKKLNSWWLEDDENHVFLVRTWWYSNDKLNIIIKHT